MTKRIKSNHVLYSVILILAAAGEKAYSFFNFSATDSGKTKYDTNWSNSSRTMPENQSMSVEKVGLSVRTADGSPVKASTLGKLMRAKLIMKISDVEVKETTLSEYFSCPVGVNADATAYGEEITAGPVFVPFKNAEVIRGGAALDFTIEIPAALGQDIELVAMLKGDHVTEIR